LPRIDQRLEIGSDGGHETGVVDLVGEPRTRRFAEDRATHREAAAGRAPAASANPRASSSIGAFNPRTTTPRQ
jgi:hypothetical protein